MTRRASLLLALVFVLAAPVIAVAAPADNLTVKLDGLGSISAPLQIVVLMTLL